VSDENFSMPFGYFVVEDISKLNYCSALKALHFFASISSINLSLTLTKNHAEPVPKYF